MKTDNHIEGRYLAELTREVNLRRIKSKNKYFFMINR